MLEVRRKRPHSNFQKPRRNGRIALVWKRIKRLRPPSEVLIPNRNFMVVSLMSFSCYDKVVLHSLRKFSYSKLISRAPHCKKSWPFCKSTCLFCGIPVPAMTGRGKDGKGYSPRIRVIVPTQSGWWFQTWCQFVVCDTPCKGQVVTCSVCCHFGYQGPWATSLSLLAKRAALDCTIPLPIHIGSGAGDDLSPGTCQIQGLKS